MWSHPLKNEKQQQTMNIMHNFKHIQVMYQMKYGKLVSTYVYRRDQKYIRKDNYVDEVKVYVQLQNLSPSVLWFLSSLSHHHYCIDQ